MKKITSFLLTLFLLLAGITGTVSAQDPDPVDPFATYTIPAITPEEVGGFSRTKQVYGVPLSTSEMWTASITTVKAPFNNQWGSWMFHFITTLDDEAENAEKIKLEFYDAQVTNGDNFKLANSALITGTGGLPLETPISIDITSDGTGDLTVFAKQGELTGSRVVTGVTEIYGVKNDYQRDVTVTVALFTARIAPIANQNLGDVLTGESIVKNITVNALGVSTPISAVVSGADAAAFNVPTTINAGDALPVTFSPTEKRAYNATITLSASGVEPVEFAVTGDANFDMPIQISSTDNSDEHWYYIQFYRRAAANLVWSLSDTTNMIVQDTLKPASVRADQQWKICGNWTDGYFLINKENGQEIMYQAEDAEDGSVLGNRYYPAAGEGDVFNFVRFKVGNELTSDWQFYNRSETSSRYVNDYSSQFICNYSANNEGNRLIFIPADEAVIAASAASLAFETPITTTVEKAITVNGLNLTVGITAILSGADPGAFSLDAATLPATGGPLKVTFSPTEERAYTATLTLTSGTATLAVSLAGTADLGLPKFSTEQTEEWYYIQFGRQDGTQFAGGVSRVWTVEPTEDGNRMGTKVMSRAIDPGNQNQQWKIAGNWDTGYKIISRNGGEMVLEDVNTSEEEGAIELRIVLTQEFGDEFLFKGRNTTAGNYNFGRWQLQIVNKDDEGNTYLNDHGGQDQDNALGLYSVGDAGAFINFIHISNVPEGIDEPTFDPNDQVVSVKYYTILGQEVVRPATTGVYVVRSTHASGRVTAVKQLIVVK